MKPKTLFDCCWALALHDKNFVGGHVILTKMKKGKRGRKFSFMTFIFGVGLHPQFRQK